MAMFIHLAPETKAKAILRSGLRLPRRIAGRTRAVHALPLTRNYALSHQWLRELKRSGQRTFVAVHFRLPDDELVELGHYGRPHRRMTAAEAVAVMMKAADAEGYEVRIFRAVGPKEIHAVRAIRQVLGWRYFPGAHGRRPCPCPVCLPRGEIRSRRIRERDRRSPGRSAESS
jgi:hypothetical protein